jgi:hypothetical protein
MYGLHSLCVSSWQAAGPDATLSAGASEEGSRAVLVLLRALGRGVLHLACFRCEDAIAAFHQLSPQHRETGDHPCQWPAPSVNLWILGWIDAGLR